MTVHIAIGNTDNRLTQQEWSRFHEEVNNVVKFYAETIHGTFVTPSTAPYQSAAWTFEPRADERSVHNFREALSRQATFYEQASIAWLEGTTDFLPGVTP